MAGQRSKRTKEELTAARDFVRALAETGGFANHYELAIAAGLAPTTVNSYWYGQSVPDGFLLLELLRAAGVADDGYRLTLPVALAAKAVVEGRSAPHQGEAARAEPPRGARRSA